MSAPGGWRPIGLRVFPEAISEAVEATAIWLAERELAIRTRDDAGAGPRTEKFRCAGGTTRERTRRSRLLRLGYDRSGEPIGDAKVPWWSFLIQSFLAPEARTRFDSIEICEYPPGGGIRAHVDSHVYVGTTAALCLGADATLTMRPRPSADGVWSSDVYSVAVPRRSFYTMTGEALEQCTHEIAIATSSSGDEDSRARLSIVFRRTDVDLSRSSSTVTRTDGSTVTRPDVARLDRVERLE